MQTYEHTQRGWLIPTSIWGGAVFSAIILWIERKDESLPLVVWLLPALLLATGSLFFSLRARVDAQHVTVTWAWNWPCARFALADIASAEKCEHSWWYGYGLRLTPRGWLWNTQGAAAVRLILRKGKCFHIGTDDPDGLLNAVNAALAARANTSAS
ncbi:MAG: hypothetical protein EXS14_10170 [Planctomycetes bacterium]|nr:hypothetical protein [Planctomycetota bacterium]